jgi:hypothetical protein
MYWKLWEAWVKVKYDGNGTHIVIQFNWLELDMLKAVVRVADMKDRDKASIDRSLTRKKESETYEEYLLNELSWHLRGYPNHSQRPYGVNRFVKGMEFSKFYNAVGVVTTVLSMR